MSGAPRPSLGGRSSIAAMNASKKREAFSFPMLTFEEICVCLQELGIHVAEEDLVKGKADIVRNVYEQLIYDCLGMTKEELYHPRSIEEDVVRFEELHEDSIPVVHFIRAMHKLLNASGIMEGYALRDLIKPDPSRVRRNLSGIINFQKYREEKMQLYRDYNARAAEMAESKIALEREREELLAQLEQEKSLRAAEQPHVDALTAEITRHSKQYGDLETAVSELKTELEDQKHTLEHLRNEIKLADMKIESAKEDLETRRQQIVASPARLRAEVDNAAKAVEDAKLAYMKAEMDRRAVHAKSEIVAKGAKDIRKTLMLLGELETEIVKLKKVAREVKAKQSEVESNRDEVSVLQAQVEHLEKTLKRVDDKCVETKQSKHVKEEAASRAINALRGELVALQDELAKIKEERRRAEVLKADLDSERENATRRHNAEMAEMLEGMKSVQKTVTEYHSRLFRSISETATTGI